MRRWKDIAVLFVQFMKFGCFTFGGGWSIVAQMQQLYVEQRHTITNEELLDLTSVGRSLPGTMIGNVAMLYGCHAAGLAGGVACVLGMVLPPMAVLALLTYCYTAVRDNLWVMAAMTGVRASIVPIMAAAALNLVKGGLPLSALCGGGGAGLRPVSVFRRELRVAGADGRGERHRPV